MRKEDIDYLSKENRWWWCKVREKERRASDKFEAAFSAVAPTDVQIVNLLSELSNEIKRDLKKNL